MNSSFDAVLWDRSIQEWVDDYPSSERHELGHRLVPSQHVPALFEFLFQAILKRHGAQVVVHPPSASKTPKRPDFLAVLPDGHELVVEVVTVNELSKEEVSISNVLTELLDHINSVESDFWVDADIHPGPLPSPPTPKEVRAFLERELASRLGQSQEPIGPGSFRQCIQGNVRSMLALLILVKYVVDAE